MTRIDPVPEYDRRHRHAQAAAGTWFSRTPLRWRFVALGVVIVAVAAIVLPTSLRAGGTQTPGLSGDVRIVNCGSTNLSGTTVGDALLAVTNNGRDVADYNITVTFTSADGGTQYDAATSTVTGLDPGQSETTDAVGVQGLPDGFICTIVDVNRD